MLKNFLLVSIRSDLNIEAICLKEKGSSVSLGQHYKLLGVQGGEPMS